MLRALGLVQRHGTAGFKDMETLARKEGYRVLYDDKVFRNGRRKGASCIVEDEDGTKYIIVDSSRNRAYQESSIAHELGHGELGHLRVDPTERDRKMESEADLYAFGIIARTATPEIAADFGKVNPDIKKSAGRFVLHLFGLMIVANLIAFVIGSSRNRIPTS